LFLGECDFFEKFVRHFGHFLVRRAGIRPKVAGFDSANLPPRVAGRKGGDVWGWLDAGRGHVG
jgi:hypothetical protein